ncbi:hypothetical protein RUM44_001873 [Polyplax serrata]|uniref:Uncharacterized protein n=1 Tax=Polyplax serrata TaxID=468196 RepID=A0ABR1ALA6_POLSC
MEDFFIRRPEDLQTSNVVLLPYFSYVQDRKSTNAFKAPVEMQTKTALWHCLVHVALGILYKNPEVVTSTNYTNE